MKYKSYIDDIYIVIISYFFAASIILSMSMIFLRVSTPFTIFSIIFWLLSILICYFITHRSYTFYKRYFVVKVGFIKKRYFYSDIDKCFITYNNKLSYATSRKRICIKSANKSIYISPEKMNDVLLILINRRVS